MNKFMGWKTFNDRLALVVLGMVGLFLGFFSWKDPALRRDILILLGPWGTILIMFYFRRREPESGTGGIVTTTTSGAISPPPPPGGPQ